MLKVRLMTFLIPNRGPMRNGVRQVFLFACVVLVVCSADAANLQKKLDKMVASYHGKVALYAKNLATGETVAIDAGTPVQTASVIKLPLMLQAFEQVKAGKLSLSQPVTLTKDNQVIGSGVLQ